MSPLVPLRPDLQAMVGYHSPQVPAEVRLNTNESPFPPPTGWQEDLAGEIGRLQFHRYPDRHVTALRQALADLHGVTPEEIFCANGSNEALQCLLLAYGGPGRRVVLFEPTYALHGHIARFTSTEVVAGARNATFEVEPGPAEKLVAESDPVLTFLCSPNNPTGRAEDPEVVVRLAARTGGLVVVDEAYGQFSNWSALSLRDLSAGGELGGDGRRRLVVVRTFSKTWAMAGARLGYLVADPEVVEACEAVALPYHLSIQTQAAGVLALRYREDMEARVALVAEERERLAAGLAALPLETWPSVANFILFRPLERSATEVWRALLDRSILVRDCSAWAGLPECLRVTIGTPVENDRFLAALEESLR